MYISTCSRFQRLSSGRVVRQIIYVPNSFDSIVSTYYRDRRLERIENFCSCHVRLLSPTHPRAAMCPPGCRTLEVNFDPVRGRYLGFHDLLSRCVHPKRRMSRVALTVVRHPNGSETQVQTHELARLDLIGPRPRLVEIRADMCTKPKLSNYQKGAVFITDILSEPAGSA
ncbi:unnamed protein product [Echinostoma caproni]|uniref:Uncharacterized protein n=1 Tax=Echinostoma caproni TaxID=27848 RepID=A0A183AZS8_9TREM|nr:unnamed protein product [Echinostoma caproni]